MLKRLRAIWNAATAPLGDAQWPLIDSGYDGHYREIAPGAVVPNAPPITQYMSLPIVAKFNDPAYARPATERWLPVLEQVLINQAAITKALTDLGTAQAQDAQTLAKVLEELTTIEAHLPPTPGPAVAGRMIFGVKHMSKGTLKFSFPDNLTAVATLALIDAAGVPSTQVDAPPVWTADQPFVTVTPAADGLSCQFKIDPTKSPVAGDVPVHASVTAAGNTFSVDDKLTVQGGPATGGVMSFVTQ